MYKRDLCPSRINFWSASQSSMRDQQRAAMQKKASHLANGHLTGFVAGALPRRVYKVPIMKKAAGAITLVFSVSLIATVCAPTPARAMLVTINGENYNCGEVMWNDTSGGFDYRECVREGGGGGGPQSGPRPLSKPECGACQKVQVEKMPPFWVQKCVWIPGNGQPPFSRACPSPLTE